MCVYIILIYKIKNHLFLNKVETSSEIAGKQTEESKMKYLLEVP